MYTAFVVFRSGHTGVYSLNEDDRFDPYEFHKDLRDPPEALADWILSGTQGEVESWTSIRVSEIASIVVTRGGQIEGGPQPEHP
jgi:hypothetical protein